MLGSHGTVLVVVPARGPATTCSQVMMAGAMTKMTTGRRVFQVRKAIALDPSLPPSPIYPPSSMPSLDPALPPIPSPYFCQPPIVWSSHCIVSFLVSSSILIYIYIYPSTIVHTYARIHLLYLVLVNSVSWILASQLPHHSRGSASYRSRPRPALWVQVMIAGRSEPQSPS